MRVPAQAEGAKAKVAEAEGAVAAIQAHVAAHDAETERLEGEMEERTAEHGAANKPVKVRVPAKLVCLIILVLSHLCQAAVR